MPSAKETEADAAAGATSCSIPLHHVMLHVPTRSDKEILLEILDEPSKRVLHTAILGGLVLPYKENKQHQCVAEDKSLSSADSMPPDSTCVIFSHVKVVLCNR